MKHEFNEQASWRVIFSNEEEEIYDEYFYEENVEYSIEEAMSFCRQFSPDRKAQLTKVDRKGILYESKNNKSCFAVVVPPKRKKTIRRDERNEEI